MRTILNQLDPKWANKKIGRSRLTIGRYGCALTALCMSLNDFGIPMMPDTMASHEDWFTGGGLIIWSRVQAGLEKMYPNKSIHIYRYYGRNDGAIRQNLRPGCGVLLQVGYKSHWIKADRKMLLKRDYACRDPWKGRPCGALGDYRNITGYVIVKIS